VYAARPDECRSYPHLHKKGFTRRLMAAVQNTTVCPISYYVFERLKMDLWHACDHEDFEDEWTEERFRGYRRRRPGVRGVGDARRARDAQPGIRIVRHRYGDDPRLPMLEIELDWPGAA